MAVPFVRQLASQPGIQLNPTGDQTDGLSLSNQDQVIGVVGRFSRGRIDRAFAVDRSTLSSALGKPESLRSSLLNEAREQIAEALTNGVFQAVVSRLTAAGAPVIRYAVWDGRTAIATPWTVSVAAPTTNYTLAIRHFGCWNDGIIYEADAVEATDGAGTPVATETVTIRAYDPANGQMILSVTGSLNPSARDEFGVSSFLPDVLATITEDFEIVVAAGATILTNSPAYGLNADGRPKTTVSTTLAVFTEGATTYANTDYDRAVAALQYTPLDFGYIISGGSRAAPLLTRLAALAYATNRHLKIDVPGDLSPAAAVAFYAGLGINSEYVQPLWTPMIADLPNGGKGMLGTGGLHAAFSARRNAQRDANGFAAKNVPIAGPDNAINRSGARQTYTPTEQELSALADGRITPVIFDRYNGGGRFVFADVLTGRQVKNSLLKLTSVAEMKGDLEDAVTRQAKEFQFLPIATFITRMNAYLDTLLNGAQSAGWLVPSRNLDGNAAFAYTVTRSNVQFADKVLIRFFTSFDGVARQIEVTQTLTR